MKIKSITKSISMSSSSNHQLGILSENFDKAIEKACEALESEEIIDVVTVISQDGTSNWQGGVHNIVMNAIIKYK